MDGTSLARSVYHVTSPNNRLNYLRGSSLSLKKDGALAIPFLEFSGPSWCRHWIRRMLHDRRYSHIPTVTQTLIDGPIVPALTRQSGAKSLSLVLPPPVWSYTTASPLFGAHLTGDRIQYHHIQVSSSHVPLVSRKQYFPLVYQAKGIVRMSYYVKSLGLLHQSSTLIEGKI